MTRYTATNPDAKLEWSKVRSTVNAMEDFKSKYGGTKRPSGTAKFEAQPGYGFAHLRFYAGPGQCIAIDIVVDLPHTIRPAIG